MNQEAFLEYNTLKYTKTGREQLLFELTERFNLHEFFLPFDPSRAPQIEKISLHLRAALGMIDSDTIRESGIPVKVRNKQSYRKRLAGTNNKSLKEIAGIAVSSGALECESDVHIHDACGGNGILSASISNLRGTHKTHSICWDRDQSCEKRHDLLRLSVGLRSKLLHFMLSNVLEADLAQIESMPTFCLSKHACGSATDIIVKKTFDLKASRTPVRTVLLTCCHGKAKDFPPFEKDTITFEEWNVLARTADWTQSKNSLETQTVGRVAMRVIDTLRVVRNSRTDLRAWVEELASPEISTKNHGIIIEKID